MKHSVPPALYDAELFYLLLEIPPDQRHHYAIGYMGSGSQSSLRITCNGFVVLAVEWKSITATAFRTVSPTLCIDYDSRPIMEIVELVAIRAGFHIDVVDGILFDPCCIRLLFDDGILFDDGGDADNANGNGEGDDDDDESRNSDGSGIEGDDHGGDADDDDGSDDDHENDDDTMTTTMAVAKTTMRTLTAVSLALALSQLAINSSLASHAALPPRRFSSFAPLTAPSLSRTFGTNGVVRLATNNDSGKTNSASASRTSKIMAQLATARTETIPPALIPTQLPHRLPNAVTRTR